MPDARLEGTRRAYDRVIDMGPHGCKLLDVGTPDNEALNRLWARRAAQPHGFSEFERAVDKESGIAIRFVKKFELNNSAWLPECEQVVQRYDLAKHAIVCRECGKDIKFLGFQDRGKT